MSFQRMTQTKEERVTGNINIYKCPHRHRVGTGRDGPYVHRQAMEPMNLSVYKYRLPGSGSTPPPSKSCLTGPGLICHLYL